MTKLRWSRCGKCVRSGVDYECLACTRYLIGRIEEFHEDLKGAKDYYTEDHSEVRRNSSPW